MYDRDTIVRFAGIGLGENMWPANPEFRTRAAQHRFEQLKKLVESLDVLPSTARVPMRILELHRSRSSTLQQFGDALIADPSLATRVVSLANSAWAGQNKPVVKVSDAVRLIGVNNLMPLLFGVSLAGLFNRADIPPSQRESLWKNSLLKAVVARHFAAQEDRELAEPAFLCGLLQDIGLPVILACDPSSATELSIVIDHDPVAAATRERDLYGMTHGTVAQVIAHRLKLPELFAAAAAGHHDIDGPTLPPGYEKLASGLRLAATVPHIASGETPGLGERFARRLLEERPGITPVAVKQLTVSLLKEFNQLLGMLGGRTPADNLRFRSFLQEVCDGVARTLTNAIGESVQMVSRLETRITELEGKAASADIDSLTGLINRRAFLERATQIFKLSSEIRSTVGVGFADVDDFKRVNDHHGHDAGDAALRALAKALKDTVGKRGIAARFGGDEFVFLLVSEGGAQQEAITNDLQNVLQQQVCKIGDKTFPVSFSCGIQWLGVPGPDADFEAHLKQADQLMYKAKKAGKNRCIVQDISRAAA